MEDAHTDRFSKETGVRSRSARDSISDATLFGFIGVLMAITGVISIEKVTTFFASGSVQLANFVDQITDWVLYGTYIS